MADKKELTADQQAELDEIFARARAALAIIETYDQARVDRLCQAVAWAVSNKVTFTRLVAEGIEESGLGAAVLNHPGNGVAWLANKLAPHGEHLAAGEIVLGGSFTRPVPCVAGDVFQADYGPLGTISIRFG